MCLAEGTSGSNLMKLGMKQQRFKLIIFCSNDNPVSVLKFYSKVKICNLGFYMGKCANDGYFRNYCIL